MQNSFGQRTIFISFQVFQFSKKSCFNIGEEIYDRIIISADDNTECLLTPSFWLLEINKKLWHRMRFFFSRNIPSQTETEERFYRKKKFGQYSKKLVGKIHEKSTKPLYNSVSNIPFTLRHDTTFL